MHTAIKKQTAVTLPLTAVRCLYKSKSGNRVVCEIDLSVAKRVNAPKTLDDMIAEARFEYATGKTRGFTDTKKLLAYLRS